LAASEGEAEEAEEFELSAEIMLGVGLPVRIVGGQGEHSGERGMIEEVLQDHCQIRLESGTLITVGRESLELITVDGASDNVSVKRVRTSDSPLPLSPTVSRKKRDWPLRPQMVVVITDKASKYVGERAIVIDVAHQSAETEGPTAMLQMSNSSIVADIPQRCMRPIRPKVGELAVSLTDSPTASLTPDEQGIIGKVIDIDASCAHIQLIDGSMALHKVPIESLYLFGGVPDTDHHM
jgi:hypothetical protein